MRKTAKLFWVVAAALIAALCLTVGGWLSAAVSPHGEQADSSTAQRPAEVIRLRPQGDTAAVQMEFPGVNSPIELTLPEVIWDHDRRLVYTETNLKGGITWRTSPDGAITGEWRKAGLASYRLTATPQPDGVLLDWTITNLSRERWPDAGGNICMRSTTVPELFDPSGQQIFLRAKGKWVSARDTGKLGSTWYLPPGKPILGIMHPYIEQGSYRISDFHPDEAIIAVRSRDSSWILAQAWSESGFLLANIHPHYQCTESPPYFGDIRAGATVHITGKIYFLRGSLGELEAAYRRDLAKGVIGGRANDRVFACCPPARRNRTELVVESESVRPAHWWVAGKSRR